MESVKAVQAAFFGAGLAILAIYAIKTDVSVGLDTFLFFSVQL